MKHRILDANLNRLSEGLRVVEDVARFGLGDADLAARLKALRHGAQELRLLLPPGAISGRDSLTDVGREKIPEPAARADAAAIVGASFGRVAESLRVIEEWGKLGHGAAARRAKAMRYESYELHKLVAGNLSRAGLAARIGGLYLILTEPLIGYEALAQLAVKAAVPVIQLREKKMESGPLLALARRLREITRGSRTLFIVNDRPDLARLSEADGVHLGQHDVSVADARAIVGDRMLVGKSTHTMKELAAALRDRPDYVGVGPLFATRSKENPSPTLGLEKARRLLARCNVPAVAIGGIDEASAPTVLAAGFRAFAIIAHVGASPHPGPILRRLQNLSVQK